MTVKQALAAGFAVENTGGGCQWLRRGFFAITDGEASLPRATGPATVFPLDQDGNAQPELGVAFPSLKAAVAFVLAQVGRAQASYIQ